MGTASGFEDLNPDFVRLNNKKKLTLPSKGEYAFLFPRTWKSTRIFIDERAYIDFPSQRAIVSQLNGDFFATVSMLLYFLCINLVLSRNWTRDAMVEIQMNGEFLNDSNLIVGELLTYEIEGHLLKTAKNCILVGWQGFHILKITLFILI